MIPSRKLTGGKVISLKLGEEGARAYAIDLGVQYDLPSTSLPFPIQVGAAAQNWGTRIHFIDENQSDPLPRIFRFGTAATLYNQGKHQVRLIGDLTASIHKLREDEEELEADLLRLNETIKVDIAETMAQNKDKSHYKYALSELEKSTEYNKLMAQKSAA